MYSIQEAFKKLERLEEDLLDVNDDEFEDDLDDYVSDIKKADDAGEEDDEIEVVDTDAETEGELLDSYEGKVIIECPVCHNVFFKDEDELEFSEDEEEDCVNTEEECPTCMATGGFKIVGKVVPYVPSDTEVEINGEEVEIEDEDEDDDDIDDEIEDLDVEEEVKESLRRMSKRDRLMKESVNRKRKYLKENDEQLGVNVYEVKVGKQGKFGQYAITAADITEAKDYIKDWAESDRYEDFVKGKWSDYLGNYAYKPQDSPDDKSDVYDFSSLKQIHSRNESLHKSRRSQINEEFEDEDLPEADFDRFDDDVDGINKDIINLDDMEDEFEYPDDDDETVFANESYNRNRRLKEAVEEFSIKDEDKEYEMETDPETEETAFTTRPRQPIAGEEMVGPMDDEDIEDIAEEGEEDFDEEDFDEEDLGDEGFGEEDFEEEPEEDMEDIDIEDFDEEGFDDLGESYLRGVYDNVKGFKTTGISSKNNKLIVEGIISFDSGNRKRTQFLLESADITNTGRLRFVGGNKQITRGAKPFTLTGKMKGKKFMCESFRYHYKAKDTDGISRRLYKTVYRGK